jgi:hypothetical protein
MKTPDSHDALSGGLRAVAEDDERYGTSSAVSMRLLAEVHAIGATRRRRTMLLSLGAAAAVILAVSIPAWRALSPSGDQTLGDAPIVTRELVTEFFPLTYSNVPARGGYVVRMQVPRSALESFGATAFASDTVSSNVLADVVVGNDGLARAVRFVQVVNDRRPVDHLRQGYGGQDDGRREQEQTP